MQTYNIHEAKTQLSKLVEKAAKGDSFVIAKAGEAYGEGHRAGNAGRIAEEAVWVFVRSDQGAG